MYPSHVDHRTSVDGESRSQLSTPPLVFTTQSAGSARQPENSPSLEPLQIASYSAVLGGKDPSLGASTGLPRSGSTNQHVNVSPIRVTCRTRDGRRSPVMVQPVGDFYLEPDVSRGTPYGYSFSDRSTPVATSSPPSPPPAPAPAHSGWPMGLVDTPISLQTPVSPVGASAAPLPPTAVHRGLEGRCRFVAFPPNLPPADATPSRGRHGIGGGGGGGDGRAPLALFIGQVRFETTAAELIWLVHRTCGACADHLESRGAGCYLLHCKSEADLPLVRSLHKRVLFDIGGVWLARTAEEIDALCEYVALDAPLLSRKAHLPRDSMVVEELKIDAPSHYMPSGRVGSRADGVAPPAYSDRHGFPTVAPAGVPHVGGAAAPYGFPTVPVPYQGSPMYGAGGATHGTGGPPGHGAPPPPPYSHASTS